MVCDWYSERIDSNTKVELRDLTSLLFTLANLNHTSYDRDQFFNKMIDLLKKDEILTAKNGDILWANLVWSLVVLNRATPEHVQSVLEPQFFSSLIESDSGKHLHQKLLQINGAAKLLMNNYEGSQLSDSDSSKCTHLYPPPKEAKVKFYKHFFDAVSILFPPPRFINQKIQNGLGLSLDAEVLVDSNGKPLEIQQYFSSSGENKILKTLPAGAKRIAFIITPLKECLLGGGMTGSTGLTARLAQASGYSPLVIDPTSLELSMAIVLRVKKLEVLVKQTAQEKN